MRGYKGFNPGLVCRGKQYAENTVFEESDAVICERGMHFCQNPFDVLDYYGLVNKDGSFNDFAEVEDLDEAKTDNRRICCTTKLKIGAKLSFPGFIKACVDFVLEKTTIEMPADKIDNKDYTVTSTKTNYDQIGSSGDSAQIGSSGFSAKIGSSGFYAQIGSSGDYAQIDASGEYAQIGSSGFSAKIGSSGDFAKIGSSGLSAQIGSSGFSAKIGSSGFYAQVGSSGDSAQIGSSGDFAKIGSSGDSAQIGSSGFSAKIGSSGDSAKIGSSGFSAKIGSSGDFAKIDASGFSAKIGSSGDFAKINSIGEHSVICCAGHHSMVKAKKGSWITIAEWKYDNEKRRNIPICVKTEFVDGERIKADVFYKLENGEFIEEEFGE